MYVYGLYSEINFYNYSIVYNMMGHKLAGHASCHQFMNEQYICLFLCNCCKMKKEILMPGDKFKVNHCMFMVFTLFFIFTHFSP